MSFAAATAFALLRSIIISVVGTCVAQSLVSLAESIPRRHRRWMWGLVAAPAIVPTLLVGYCYRDTSLTLIHRPVWNELLYGLLVSSQLVPIAVLVLKLTGPLRVSSAAAHAAWLAFRGPCRDGRVRAVLLSLWARHYAGRYGIAATALFLLSFQETELASLMQSRSWTEWMFTALASGLQWEVALQRVAVPVMIQCLAMIPLLVWIRHLAQSHHDGVKTGGRSSLWAKLGAGGWLVLSLLLTVLLPTMQLVVGAVRGWGVLAEQPSFPREVGHALLLGVTSGGLASLAAWRILQPGRGAWLRSLGIVPGLLGALPLSVLLAAFFQTDALAFAYDTPGPLILGETLFLVPKAVVLMSVVRLRMRSSSNALADILRRGGDAAQRLRGADLDWQIRGMILFWTVTCVCFLGFMELTVPSQLAPPGVVPAPMVLYNALHYGRIAALATKLFVTLLAPLLVVGLLLAVRRPLLRYWVP